MIKSSLLGKKARVLFVCLLSLLMISSLCIAASAIKDEQTLITFDPNDMTSLKGQDDNFTWEDSGKRALTYVDTSRYSDKAIQITNGMFKINDTKKLLEDRQAVVISADLYFSAFPSGIYEETDNKTGETIYSSPDPNTTHTFSAQSVMTWFGSANGSNRYDGIRIDSKGNLYYGTSLTTAMDVQLKLNKWYNLKLIYSAVSNSAEFWLDGTYVLTVDCRYRETSDCVRFFDAKFSYDAYIKNISISATDTEYVCGLAKVASADFISYQATKPAANGSFKLRIIAGVDSLMYDCFGYKIIILTKDANGNTVSKEVTGTNEYAYSSIYGGNTLYSIEDTFGYKYACLATIENLSKNSKFTELVIYPYTVADGNKVYGTPVSLVYKGTNDKDGYPEFTKSEVAYTLKPTDDTYINGANTSVNINYGTKSELFVRNTGSETTNSYRAAYFKFTIPKETVDRLDTLANVFLRLSSSGYETYEGRVKQPLVLFAAKTGWSEATLTYSTRDLAGRGDEIARSSGDNADLLLSFNVLEYLKEQPKNDDGSLTVSFCLTQEDGHSDALLLYIYSRESGSNSPYLSFEESLYGHSVSNVKSENAGYEPLSYAEKLVDNWFDELYPELYLDKDGNILYHDELGAFDPNGYATTTGAGDFTYDINWKAGHTWQSSASKNPRSEFLVTEDKWSANRFARTLSTLGTSTSNKYLNSAYQKTTQYDPYGGIINLDFKGSSGFFHTETNPKDGRTYIIDPLGNPYFAVSVNAVDYGNGDTENQREYVRDTYENAENFFTEISASLRDIGINTAFVSSSDDLLAVKQNGLAVTVSAVGISDYMINIGRSRVSEGKFPHNNTINVFDPDFVTYVAKKNKALIQGKGYAEMTNLFAYTADNELPSGDDILVRYLTLDPSVSTNIFSYQTAWTWLARKLDKVNPTLEDLQKLKAKDLKSINSEFLGFLYAQYYKAVGDSIRAVDPNHMYIGSRVNGTCPEDEGYLRAAGKYLDIISINLYGGLNPDKEIISGIYRYSGKPFIVTEFFAKGLDAIDANGLPLATSTGAGILVHTQEERAVYYEHYVLNLLESKSCVGWSWYRFRDNDQSLYTVIGKDGTVYENVIFLSTTYGEKPYPNSLMTEDGQVHWLSFFYDGDPKNWENAMYGTGENAKPVFTKTYAGEKLASNQNINKGYYNNNFSSVVTVYSYNSDGTLDRFPDGNDLYTFGSKSYEVQHPTSAYLANGTVLTSTDGKTKFTIGKKINGDGSYTITELTVYRGRYIELTDAVKKMSDNLAGLIGYLDNN